MRFQRPSRCIHSKQQLPLLNMQTNFVLLEIPPNAKATQQRHTALVD